ncbi:MAG: hypothetical protein ABEJ42_02080, partial [Halobacteriaceae archaeon]
MSDARLLALPPPALLDARDAALADLLAYFDPDGAWVVGPERAPRLHARVRHAAGCPVVHPRLGRACGGVRHDRVGDVDVVSARDAAALASLAERGVDADLAAGAATYLACPAVAVDVRPTSLTAGLTNAGALLSAVEALPGDVTVLSGALPADYDRRWAIRADGAAATADGTAAAVDGGAVAARVRLRGTGDGAGRHGPGAVTALALDADGTVGAERVPADAFGLRALTGVGPATADALRAAGYESRADVA